MSYSVGQRWILVDQRWGGKAYVRPVIITKVGRKWATLDDSTYRPTRVDIATGLTEGGRGRLYRDIDQYYARLTRNKAWDDLRQRMAHYPTDESIPEADIRAAAALLRIEIP